MEVVCWCTGLQIVQPLWTSYTAKTVMKESHDQGPEFMGNEFQYLAGAASVLTMSIDSQSPWQNGKTERAGQSFKHQLWDLDEKCHIEGETEFEAAVASVVTRGTDIAIRQVSLRINACLVPTWTPVE